MKDLKQYRKVWQAQEYADKQLDADTLTKMIHKKSSSIVKWIFYISVIEFVVLTLINIFGKTYRNELDLKELGLYHFMVGVGFFVGYIIPLLFIYLFYKNYKKISVTSTTKELIYSILNTRKTVKYYIITILTIVTFALLYSTYVILQTPEYAEVIKNFGENGALIVWGIVVLLTLLFVGIILVVYLLLYGILLKRLKSNYKELLSS